MKKLLRLIWIVISQMAIVLGILALTALTVLLWGVIGLAGMAVTEVVIIVVGGTLAVIAMCMPCLSWGEIAKVVTENLSKAAGEKVKAVND